jgi:hypothetical protein
MNYESETLHAYQTVERARQYHRHHTTAWSWARFMTGLEHRAVGRAPRRAPGAGGSAASCGATRGRSKASCSTFPGAPESWGACSGTFPSG